MSTVRLPNILAALIISTAVTLSAAASPGPTPEPMAAALPSAVDRAYPGVVDLAVDATDIERRIIRVHERIPVSGGALTLLYPEWIPGTHAPEGPIDRFAGLVIRANGEQLAWVRDEVEMYAFHVTVPRAARELEVDFDYLSPVSTEVGETEVSSEILLLEWTSLALYPAGYYTRQIPIRASVTLPHGWESATALGACVCVR